MNNKTTDYSQNQPEDTSTYNPGQIVRWVGISLIIVAILSYFSYTLGSNENKRKINRLNKEIHTFNQVESLDSIVNEFQSISRDMKLSTNERARLTELLDQLILHKTNLEAAERELKQVKSQMTGLKENYQNQVDILKNKNQSLETQVAEFEMAMSYTQGTVERFEISVNDSYSIFSEPSSRVGLQQILNNGTAQIYVGNALIFFHIGHTLRFRFPPNWLCDITLTKINDEEMKVEFEYTCELN